MACLEGKADRRLRPCRLHTKASADHLCPDAAPAISVAEQAPISASLFLLVLRSQHTCSLSTATCPSLTKTTLQNCSFCLPSHCRREVTWASRSWALDLVAQVRQLGAYISLHLLWQLRLFLNNQPLSSAAARVRAREGEALLARPGCSFLGIKSYAFHSAVDLNENCSYSLSKILPTFRWSLQLMSRQSVLLEKMVTLGCGLCSIVLQSFPNPSIPRLYPHISRNLPKSSNLPNPVFK